MIDLDAYVCPFGWCWTPLHVYYLDDLDEPPSAEFGVSIWPNGDWSCSCVECGHDECGNEDDHPTYRNLLPPAVVEALENPRSVWRSTEPPEDRFTLRAHRRVDGRVGHGHPTKGNSRPWDPREDLWAETPVLEAKDA